MKHRGEEMLFSSFTFLFAFLPILLVLYFAVQNRKIKNLILLAFSILFYSWGEPKYIFLMLATIFVSYIFGLLIDKFGEKPIQKKLAMISSIVIILGSLIFFKYSNFLMENVGTLIDKEIKYLNIVLPIGISFYTFQILSYIIDLYNKKIKVQKDFTALALYVTLFPQLIAGPIVRYETVEDELENRKENFDDIISGTKRFIVGLSKKVLIANSMGQISDTIFAQTTVGTSLAWLAVITYALQIYYDFSGYSDMAIGLGKIFGFHFLENFDYPYISKSITDFWRRWHISLSTWFRDYIYIPLGGNRVSKLKWIRNIFLVWLFTGIWHGASWNYVLWGLYYFVILFIEKIFLSNYLEKIPKFLRWVYATFLILIGWVIFRCESLELMGNTLSQMFVYQKTEWGEFIKNNLSLILNMILMIPAIIFSFPVLKNIKKQNALTSVLANISLIILFVLDITFLTSATYNPFIYFRF